MNLFFYGTLQDPAVLELVARGQKYQWGPEGKLCGHRAYCVLNEVYPVIVPEFGAQTSGRLLINPSPKLLDLLDHFEEDYERQELEIETAQEIFQAQVYVGTEPPDLKRPFDYENWAIENKDSYLIKVASWQKSGLWGR